MYDNLETFVSNSSRMNRVMLRASSLEFRVHVKLGKCRRLLLNQGQRCEGLISEIGQAVLPRLRQSEGSGFSVDETLCCPMVSTLSTHVQQYSHTCASTHMNTHMHTPHTYKSKRIFKKINKFP